VDGEDEGENEEDEESEDDEEGEDDEDDEEGENDEELPELPLNTPSLVSIIARMKQQSGPVSAVLLSADGRSKQVTLDMTPKEDAVGQLLGGKATFVGSYPAPLDGVVMALREDVVAVCLVCTTQAMHQGEQPWPDWNGTLQQM